jgi:hypothetical protein
MFEEWLKQDTEASWITVVNACTSVKHILLSDEPHTKDHIEALNQLFTTLPVFLENV